LSGLGMKADDAATDRFLDRRRRQLGEGLVEARRIAADEIEPTVRPATQMMRAVLAAGLHRLDPLPRARGLVLALLFGKFSEPVVADEQERVAFPKEAVSACFWFFGKLDCANGFPRLRIFDENADVIAAADDDAALGVERHVDDIGRQIVAGVLGDFKA